MTADPTSNTGPATSKAPPGGARPTARQLLKELDGPADERFKRSLASLSCQLGERVARRSASDPQAAAEARRAALQAYDLARARRLKMVLRAAGAVVATAGVTGLTVLIAMPADWSWPHRMASAERAPRVEVAAVAPAPIASPPAAPSPNAPPSSASSPNTPPLNSRAPSPLPSLAIVPVAAEVAPEAASEPAPAKMTPVESASVTPAPAPLQRDEVREVQAKLYFFGFNPGPLDGAPGPVTQAAAARYRESRGRPQAELVDRDLLEQLRQDPAPRVAATQVTSRTAPPGPVRATNSSSVSPSDPFESLRAAANRFEQWVQSLGR